MSDKQMIHDWQEKVRTTYGEEARLYDYLFSTMDNFYYRYLETTVTKGLRTVPLAPHLWGAKSLEPSMVEALKLTNPVAKKGIMELAKSVPKSQGPAIQLGLTVNVEELTADHGVIHLEATIDWGFPEFQDSARQQKKKVTLRYSDLAQFRKELALKLEETCEIFL